MQMPKPKSFDSLVSFLAEAPFLRKADGNITRVVDIRGGHLLFEDGSHTPAGQSCGPGAKPVELIFDDTGFEVVMFGQPLRYEYAVTHSDGKPSE